MKTRKQKETHFKLYMIRHGISCGNVNYHLKDMLALSLYTDPELTQEGRDILSSVRANIKKNIEGPYLVGASNMIRAQQTANILFNPKKIYIIPAINEFGQHNQENTPLRPSVQGEVLSKITGDGAILTKRDYTLFEEYPGMTDVTQVSTFLQWLGTHYKKLASKSRATKPNLVFVSHFGFIKELMCRVDCGDSFVLNSALIEFNVKLVNQTATLTSVKQIFHSDLNKLSIDLPKNLASDTCRIPLRKPKQKLQSYKKFNKTHKKGL